jgi:hypothetical protein
VDSIRITRSVTYGTFPETVLSLVLHAMFSVC